jgi:hypothetical protein
MTSREDDESDTDCNLEGRKSSECLPPDQNPELLEAVQEYNLSQENERESLRLQREAEKRMVPPRHRRRR